MGEIQLAGQSQEVKTLQNRIHIAFQDIYLSANPHQRNNVSYIFINYSIRKYRYIKL